MSVRHIDGTHTNSLCQTSRFFQRILRHSVSLLSTDVIDDKVAHDLDLLLEIQIFEYVVFQLFIQMVTDRLC